MNFNMKDYFNISAFTAMGYGFGWFPGLSFNTLPPLSLTHTLTLSHSFTYRSHTPLSHSSLPITIPYILFLRLALQLQGTQGVIMLSSAPF